MMHGYVRTLHATIISGIALVSFTATFDTMPNVPFPSELVSTGSMRTMLRLISRGVLSACRLWDLPPNRMSQLIARDFDRRRRIKTMKRRISRKMRHPKAVITAM